jgi:transposase
MTFVERYKAGQSLREIAAAEGVSHETIRTWLKAAGVKLRPRNWRRHDSRL